MKTTLSNLEDGLSLPLLGTMLLSPEGKCLEHSIRIKKKKFNDPPSQIIERVIGLLTHIPEHLLNLI